MKIFLKDNNVLSYREKLTNVDISIEPCDVEKRHVYLGTNGIGKTFCFRMLSNTAYLNSIQDHSPYHDFDTQRIIQNMLDVGIGSRNEEKSSEYYKIIKHTSVYYDESLDSDVGSLLDVDEDAKNVLIAGKILKGMETPYCLKIDVQLKKFLDTYNIVYYSNSQYPSNDTFFSERASSFRSIDVDHAYWMVFKDLSEKNDYGMRVWKNNSYSSLKKQNKKEVFEHLKKEMSKNDFINSVRYTYRNILNFYGTIHIDKILNCRVVKDIEKIFLDVQKFPIIFYELNKLSVEDYIFLILLKELDKTFNFELYKKIKGNLVPISKLNSGERYLLTLKCLESIYNSSHKKTLIIVDEPENSLHLMSLKEIVKSENNGCIFWVATHSPAYAISLINELQDDVILHVFSKENDKLEEHIYNKEMMSSLSMDSFASEFFSYSPFLDKFEEMNFHISEKNMIGIDEFYERLNKLRDN